MDWFEAITGFKESNFHDTQSQIFERDSYLHSSSSSHGYAIGKFHLQSLAELRRRRKRNDSTGRLSVQNVSGDARAMHTDSRYGGALFQVASQFNMLEMVHPRITPEDGVTGYQDDHTQGPACAIAAGAATIYRNYLVPIRTQRGQTAARQIDGLEEIGAKLAEVLDTTTNDLWEMKNGYALASREGLQKIGELLASYSPKDRDTLKGCLQIGLHVDCQVTDAPPGKEVFVSQAFCSALPVAYADADASVWEPFARLVLEAAYEATILAGLENARRGKSRKVLLTRLGGGAFGNRDEWIDDAIRMALDRVVDEDLDVFLVSYGPPPDNMLAIERHFA